MSLVTIDVPALGNRCHLVHDGRRAVVVDPPRDIAARRAGRRGRPAWTSSRWPTPTCTTTTSRARSAWPGGTAPTTCSPPTSRVAFERVGVRGGDVAAVRRRSRLEVLATPGPHPPPPVLPRPRAPASRRRSSPAAACCSGPSAAPTSSTRGWRCTWPAPSGTAPARQAALDPATLLLPTHGFGSFCAGATVGRRRRATARHHRRPARHPPGAAHRPRDVRRRPGRRLRPDARPTTRTWTRSTARAPARPAPGPRRSPPTQVDAAVPPRRWVVDLRDRRPPRRGAPAAARSASSTPTSSRRTSAGWCRGAPTCCCSPTRRDRSSRRVRDLAGIGIEGVGVHVLDAGPRASTRGFRRADWADVRRRAEHAERRVVVDVRQRDEWAEGHLPGAVHVPVQDVERRRAPCPGRAAGCTASPATAPASPPASCTGSAATSCTSTTRGSGSPSWRIQTTRAPPDRARADHERSTATPHTTTHQHITHLCGPWGPHLGKVEETCARHLSPAGRRGTFAARRRRRRARRPGCRAPPRAAATDDPQPTTPARSTSRPRPSPRSTR